MVNVTKAPAKLGVYSMDISSLPWEALEYFLCCNLVYFSWCQCYFFPRREINKQIRGGEKKKAKKDRRCTVKPCLHK